MKLKKILIPLICILICTGSIATAATKSNPVDVLKKQVATLQAQVNSFKKQLKAKDGTIDSFKKQVIIKDSAINSFKKQVATLQSQVNSLKKQVAQTMSLTYIVDGVEKSPNKKAIVCNGELYLPAKYVTEAVGKNYTWDSAGKKIYISNTGEVVKPLKKVYLYKKPYVDSTFKKLGIDDDESGNKLIGSWLDDNDTTYIIYALNGKATKLNASIGVGNDYENSSGDGYIKYTIYDENDNLLYTSPKVIATTEWQDINVDVTGKLQVKIVITSYGDSPEWVNLRNLNVLTTDY
jgi:prefoldin subunit 5